MQKLLEEKYRKSKALRKEEHVLSCTIAIRVDFLWECWKSLKSQTKGGDKNNGSGNYRWKNYGQRTSGRSPYSPQVFGRDFRGCVSILILLVF